MGIFRRKGSSSTKYGANKIVYQDEVYDSKYELQRYLYLRDLEKKGVISNLRRQTPFLLIPRTTRLVPKQLKTKVKYVERVVELQSLYHNDFTYIENGIYVSEEFKSVMTSKLADYILRRKLMVHKIDDHNRKGRSQWIFREVVYYNKNKTIITDK
jgi:hypothetical protein